MRVGILTFQWAPNYGAVLQAWGLETALRELGHEPTFIEYVPPYLKRRISPFAGWGLQSGLRFSKIKTRLQEQYRRRGFQRFKYSHLQLSPKFRSRHALREYCSRFDAIIVGSDQIWNMHWHTTFDDTYFLGFLDGFGSKIQRIAYGPCFGSPDQPVEHLQRAKDFILQFDAIGMRNQFGIEMLAQMGISDVRRVVDPAFFLPRARSLATEGKGISVYAVYPTTASLCSTIASFAQPLLNQPVRQLSSETPVRLELDNLETIRYADPEKWLHTIAGSRFICSESFHGVVFAIANDIPFVAATSGIRAHRIRDLLTHYRLDERLIDSGCAQVESKRLRRMIEETPHVQGLRSEIDSSKEFLKQALGN